jgi:hypothetical protein
MDNLISNELATWHQDWILNSHLYFPEGIYVKYSPRAGSQSLKSLLIDILFPENDFHFDDQKRILQKIVVSGYEAKVKIAVKRDPVDRFLSALNWDYEHWGKGEYKGTSFCPDDIDLVLEKNGWFDFMFENNKHYFPQTFYLKNPYDYDLIFDIQKLSFLVQWLNEQYNTDFSVPWVNSTKKHFTKNMLTDKHVQIIKDKYSVDYENGWY